jgi:hypothetical protein
MSVDGTWKLTMQTPIGERKSTLNLVNGRDGLAGKLAGDEGNSTQIYEGKADGNNVSWKADIKSPMPLTLEFTGTVSGDSISGAVKAAVGSWPFTGSRA